MSARCPVCGFDQPPSPLCARCGEILGGTVDMPPMTHRVMHPPPAPPVTAPRLPDAGFASVGLPTRLRITVFDQLGRMIAAGLPVDSAFATLRATSPSRRMQGVAAFLEERLGAGDTLAAAMAALPQDFTPEEVGTVAAAEQSARLPAAFERLAARLTARRERTRALLAGLVYPSFVLLTSFFLMPLATLVMGDTGGYVQSALLPLGALAALGTSLAYGVPRLVARPGVAAFLRRVAVHLPVLSGMFAAAARATFCERLAEGLDAGLPFARSLRDAATATAHPAYRAALPRLEAAVDGGASFADALRTTRLFPATAHMPIAAGERAGTLEGSLRSLAEGFEKDLEQRARVVSRLMTLVLTVLILGYVGLRVFQGMSGVLGSAEEQLMREFPDLPFEDMQELREVFESSDEFLRGPAIRPMP